MARSLIVATILAGLCLLRPAPAIAQIEEVRIEVVGLTCNLCAAGLERLLRRVEGVSSVEVSMAEESASVQLVPGATFDPEILREAVVRAGQHPRAIEVRLTAGVQRQGGKYSLRPGEKAPALMVRAESGSTLGSFVGQTVRARATVHSSAGVPLELELTEFEAVR